MQALIATADVKKLSAIAVEKNTASVKIMSKLGMKYIKTYFHKDPLFSSEVVYYELEV
jgi:RimJ/RimL family protein N-acetyltransferase